MNLGSATRVLLIDSDDTTSSPLATFLIGKRYDVQACTSVESVPFVVSNWRPHVVVLATPVEAKRHERLEEIRKLYPRLPLVVLTIAEGPELLLDVEAFAPTLPARPSRGFSEIESAVAAASAMA